MGKFDEKIELYVSEFKGLGVNDVDVPLLTAVTKACGPSIYLPDASKVSTSDQVECDRVKKNFLVTKLGLADSPDLDKGMEAAVAVFGSANKSKYRAMFYYLLVKHFKKEGLFK
ncbi:MAG TPA: DUF2853 family protein [Saprospiraceae bacterium]|nr:DUF2853 family protein [Saprospiraceae bacterium]